MLRSLSLADEIQQVLTEHYQGERDRSLAVERTDGSVVVLVASERLRGMGPFQMMEAVWEVLEGRVGAAEIGRVEVVLAFTPDEPAMYDAFEVWWDYKARQFPG